MSNSELSNSSNELVVNQEQRFEQLNLKELGLQVQDFAEVMDAHQELADISTTVVAEYGKNIANKTSTYTDELLNLVQNKDLDATGQKLNEVVHVAQQLNTTSILNKSKSSGFFGGLLGKFKGAKQSFDQHFNTTKEQIDVLVKEIESSQSGLKARVGTLDKMFDAVQDEYKQLGVYIAAGQLKQQDIQQQISTLTTQEQDQQTTQQIYDLNHLANNLEKRVSDLQVLQQSAMQTLPMIRIIQSNNLMLVDKFYAIKNITLPAWKNQISLAISLQEQKNSVQLAKAIDDTTNDLLRRNAELLHQNSVDTAKANQRSVIDVETLEHVQNTLIKTVNDVIQIQKEGMQKRAEATTRLRALQESLNQLVLENSQSSQL
ncbi:MULTISPECIES: toxic anion resistance protein [Acinetobacter]|uniref:toxic anion resistance protein n=1 Tax=Acinetobacter TaxID=469 RepID=UPI000C3DCAAD|nr:MULTISPECIES: toxic anion resistance protein [Acinetobacter]MEC8568544.1 toxic anion resistance protein [Pseudomonadota bacterium]MBC67775.1 toxic anion resistance protein [Acinetobacter sp.]MBT51562.1 toxic anion resistance protein [Acinetobacter sp.]HIQ34666.1 toxic anion resistance protein [Acinetobacter venetianus]HJP48086.1 toxic anion resistance protein [Acinetobacter venetianus]|tara:strand:- start:1006 stop:2130 length:1125 start_codon:yes stop_codon:yes gene_type:complete